jgi:hypothetical protein
MKRLFLVLCLLLLSKAAWATNCTLPYTLTNGTTADATQVMGNFNALLSCESFIGVQAFTTSGTYTCDPGTNKVIVEVMGGGGGGAGASASSATTASFGSGGSAGAYFKGLATSGFCGASVTVGSGGSGGTTITAGTGGTSSFILSTGVNITVTGGQGNVTPVATPTGSYGNAPGGVVQTATGVATTIASMPGQRGGFSAWISTIGFNGKGADSILGIGGPGVGITFPIQQAGAPGVGYGCGGGGAVSFYTSGGTNQTGANGCPGIVVVWEHM